MVARVAGYVMLLLALLCAGCSSQDNARCPICGTRFRIEGLEEERNYWKSEAAVARERSYVMGPGIEKSERVVEAAREVRAGFESYVRASDIDKRNLLALFAALDSLKEEQG